MNTYTNTKESRTVLRNFANFLQNQVVAQQREVDLLRWCIERMVCGCLSKDCNEHGSYVTEEIEFVKNHFQEAHNKGFRN